MKKFATASFAHETNTFSPITTTWESFAARTGPFSGILTPDEIRSLKGVKPNRAIFGFFDTETELGYEVYPILGAYATPSGMIPTDVFDRIVGMILDGIRQNGPFDGVFLDLHGAMVYEGYNDGETEILRRVRNEVGSIPIVTSYDLHGNITQETFDIASAMIGCRTYPHVDLYEIGIQCAHLMNYIEEGKPIYKSFRRVPFLLPLSTQSTNIEPAKSLFRMIVDVEKDPEVISASIMEGFQAADIPEMGPSIFTYAVNQKAAERAADLLLGGLFARESQFRSDLPNAQNAVQQALKLVGTVKGPVILSDTQDNAGGGATSDTTEILAALIQNNVQNAALGLMYDPDAAQKAHTAGVGADITLDLGGKLMPGDKPIHATFHVEKLYEGDFDGSSPMSHGIPLNLGKMANLKIGGISIVVSSIRKQALDRMYFRIVGINPEEKAILVVKSSNHYRADFEPIAGSIISVAAFAACIENPIHIPYRNLREGVRLQGLGPVFTKPEK